MDKIVIKSTKSNHMKSFAYICLINACLAANADMHGGLQGIDDMFEQIPNTLVQKKGKFPTQSRFAQKSKGPKSESEPSQDDGEESYRGIGIDEMMAGSLAQI